MEFKFSAHQAFQIDAVNAVVDLFEGQRHVAVTPVWHEAVGAVPNRLDLDDGPILGNLQAVQKRNGLGPDSRLQLLNATVDTGNGSEDIGFMNFSVEMETGTGKTYVYIRTMLELYRRYGMRKYIVVVPSVAIREGVLKHLQMTKKHFKELLGNLPYRYYVYTSANLSQVRQFALSDGVEVMIMTIDSFNKELNVIRQTTDRLQGETPIHLVQAARPILILDEPQNMESEKSVAALAALHPLFALRYSATHRNPYNLTYRLTPYDAYRDGLVKKIEVASVMQADDENEVYLRVDSVATKKHTVTARVAVHQLMKNGTVKERLVKVKPQDSLQERANRPEYAPFVVDDIDPVRKTVLFTNGLELRVGEAQGADKEAIFEAQIRYTVEEHFRKQRRLKDAGIKVLSLFFIDRVKNYAEDDGIIRRLFNRAFDDCKMQRAEWKKLDPEDVQAAYFAEMRRRGGEVVYQDSLTGSSKKDEEAYELIMKAKERLLSFDEPVSFIFTHSALREGWDNPNVFQICTLNQSVSDIKKRQEVGRGVRLPVNQEGDRVQDEQINVLTVVANESYEKYVANLQREIEGEYGPDGVPPKPANARKRAVVRLNKRRQLSPEFRELWKRISQKTRYAVKIDSKKLIGDASKDLDRMKIPPPRVTINKVVLGMNEADVFEAISVSGGAKTVKSLAGRYPLPNLLRVMEHLMQDTSPPVRLTRATLLAIIEETRQQKALVENPHGFAQAAVKIIKEKLADHLVNGIQYQKIDEWWEMCQFDTDIQSWLDNMVPAKHCVYDHVVFESEIEKKFAEDLERRPDVKVYVKLPGWFTVDTPIGEYNPDWAIVMEERDEHGQVKDVLYLVRETKGTKDLSKLRADERQKVRCGKEHFKALDVDYELITSAAELRSG